MVSQPSPGVIPDQEAKINVVQHALLYQSNQFGLLQLKIYAVNSEFDVFKIVIFVFHHISVNARGCVVCLGDNEA